VSLMTVLAPEPRLSTPNSTEMWGFGVSNRRFVVSVLETGPYT